MPNQQLHDGVGQGTLQTQSEHRTGLMEFDLSVDRDSGSAGVQGFATENVAEMQQASAASQHRALNAGGSLRKGPTASCPDLTAHSLDHAVEEFDFPDPGLTLMSDLVP